MSAGLVRGYDERLIPGARNAIETCLRVLPDQAVYVLTDRKTESVGRALADAARKVSPSVRFEILEDHVERPSGVMPEAVMAPLEDCQVCLYAVFPQPGELPSRQTFVRK